MDELTWVRDRVRERERAALARLAPERHEALLSAQGPDALLHERSNAWRELSAGCFQAALFRRAADYFRRQHENLAEYASWLDENADAEGARLLREERARFAWGPGDLPLFGRYVEEGCHPDRGLTPGWDAWPSLFLAWATLGRRVHAEHWLPRWEEAEGAERRDVRLRHPDAPEHAEAVLVDSRCARVATWRGDLDAAAGHARRAADVLRGWGRDRPRHLRLPEKRVWLHRLEGTAALAEGRTRPERLDDAALSFTRALEAAFFTHSLDWKDLVLLRVAALAWRDEGHALARDFRESFPHLRHLVAREGVWAD